MVKARNRHICIIRRFYYPAALHVRRNAESLAEAGYAVDLICPRDEGEAAFEIINGVRVHRMPIRTRREGLLGYVLEYQGFFWMVFFYLTWLHIKQPFAVIEADAMPDFLVFTGLIPRLMGARLILYLYDHMPQVWSQKRNIPMTHWFIRILKWQEKLSCSFADAVICVHELLPRCFNRRENSWR